MMVAADLRQTEARDGPEGDAVALNKGECAGHRAAGQRDEVHLRGPAEDGLPLGADRQVEEQSPDLRVRQKGDPRESCSACAPGTSRASSMMVEVPWNVRNHWDNRHVKHMSTNVRHDAGADADAI